MFRWNTVDERNLFLKLKAKFETTSYWIYKAQKFSWKKTVTVADMQQLPDIEVSAS